MAISYQMFQIGIEKHIFGKIKFFGGRYSFYNCFIFAITIERKLEVAPAIFNPVKNLGI